MKPNTQMSGIDCTYAIQALNQNLLMYKARITFYDNCGDSETRPQTCLFMPTERRNFGHRSVCFMCKRMDFFKRGSASYIKPVINIGHSHHLNVLETRAGRVSPCVQ